MRSARHHAFAFWAVAYAFLAVMTLSSLPTPLYVLYQERDGFSTFMVTVIFAVYALGAIVALFVAGHASDWIGRRRALAPAIALAMLAAVVFLVWPALPGLLVARVLSGLAVGVTTATATAYLTELHLARHPRTSPHRAQLVATAANIGGIGLGPLVGGALAQWGPAPLRMPYEILVAALALGVLAIVASPETRQRPTLRRRYRPQGVAVPASDRARFFAAAGGAAIAFSAFGLFTSLAPSFLAGTLGHTSRMLAGATAFAVFAAAVLAQTVLPVRAPRALLASGMAGLILGLGLVVVAVWLPAPSLALFVGGGIVVGAAGGLLFKGAMLTVGALAPAERRAEALAGFFLCGYVGLALPVVGVGLLSEALDARTALAIFAAVVGVALLIVARTLLVSDRAATRGRVALARFRSL